ncbi:MAG TPA: hypothetical protein VJG67_03705 [Candidatus Paceibacterota bacterium]|uniref:DOT1 domain-containing protein n=1 Tax=Candidatus Zambryskibacteria bacterium RIFCSPLOWO2_01_FULL_35_19 TaxID=1802757 RepID=A0A1G2TZ98_9BACT|nr:MAG: hypothetical protein A3A90_01755 [Candidatus Zambryskibacteria bacterium RIFCSPLOWO2_01_FULL_35_19]
MLIFELLFIISLGLILLLICFVIVITFIESYFLDAPFVSTEKSIIDKIISNLRLDEKSVLIDLGCGDGRILRHAVIKIKSMSAIGFEYSLVPFLLAKFTSRCFKQIQIKKTSIFNANIQNATHIYVYLYPKCLNKLGEKFKKECQDGVKIISCDFEIKNFKLIDTIILDDKLSKYKHKLFIYNIK